MGLYEKMDYFRKFDPTSSLCPPVYKMSLAAFELGE
jgi:hypothetical protein